MRDLSYRSKDEERSRFDILSHFGDFGLELKLRTSVEKDRILRWIYPIEQASR